MEAAVGPSPYAPVALRNSGRLVLCEQFSDDAADLHEVVEIAWFLYVPDGPELGRLRFVLRSIGRAEYNHSDVAAAVERPDVAMDFLTGFLGQIQIEQDQVRTTRIVVG